MGNLILKRKKIAGIGAGNIGGEIVSQLAMQEAVDIVSALVAGGHGELMAPVTSNCSVNGIPVRELLPETALHTIIGAAGVKKIIELQLTADEHRRLRAGADYIASMCRRADALMENGNGKGMRI